MGVLLRCDVCPAGVSALPLWYAGHYGCSWVCLARLFVTSPVKQCVHFSSCNTEVHLPPGVWSDTHHRVEVKGSAFEMCKSVFGQGCLGCVEGGFPEGR